MIILEKDQEYDSNYHTHEQPSSGNNSLKSVFSLSSEGDTKKVGLKIISSTADELPHKESPETLF